MMSTKEENIIQETILLGAVSHNNLKNINFIYLLQYYGGTSSLEVCTRAYGVCIGIAETVRDAKTVKLWQSREIWGLIKFCLVIEEILDIFRDVREKMTF